MKKHRTYLLLIFLIFLYTSICAISYVHAINTTISDEIFRLHVIANSNSEEDQNLKYIVRDEILNYINSNNFKTKNELITYLNNNLDDIKSIAQNTVINNGFTYNVDVEIGNFDFPTKTYGDIAFPAGTYNALKIKLGNFEGQNWWCVMFPPLCFIDITSGIIDENSKEILKNNLSEEEYSLVSQDSVAIKFKFKLFELFNTFHSFLASN